MPLGNRIPLLVAVAICLTISLPMLLIEPIAAQEPYREAGRSNQPTPVPAPTLLLTGVGSEEASSASLVPAQISDLALTPVDCTVMSPPVVGFEISKGQDPNDMSDFFSDLTANGYSLGTVDISGSLAPPPCVNILIVQGLTQNGALSSSYTAPEGALLQAWVNGGHGLMLSGDWGPFRESTQELFGAFGYNQEGTNAVSDPTDFDPADPTGLNIWVIYRQADNLANHPIFNGVESLEFLASSWLSPEVNTIVSTDAVAANPPNVPVMAAFTDGAGCVILSTDSNWAAREGYFKEDNARIARQSIAWLSGCNNLRFSKLATPDPVVQAGQLLTYTLMAFNDSASALSDLVITDTVPANTSFVAATSPHLGPDVSNVITWPVGVLDLNSSTTVTMVVQVGSLAPNNTLITNTAWLTSSVGLTETATAITRVATQNQIVNPIVTKAVAPDQAARGEVVTFTLTVEQVNSNSDATGVRVVDPLPEALDILRVQASIGLTTTVGQVVTWTIPVLAPLELGLMSIQARVDDNTTSEAMTLRNQAILSFDQGPDRLSNQVEIFVPAASPSPEPTPTATPAGPSDGYDDDDEEDDIGPPPVTPAAISTAKPAALEELPVAFLPETGIWSASWITRDWLISGFVLLLIILVLGIIRLTQLKSDE